MKNPSDDDDDAHIEEEDEQETTTASFQHPDTESRAIDEQDMRMQDSEGKLGDNDTPLSREPGSVSVLDSLLLHHRRSQQSPQEELTLADIYRIRRDQGQLQYVQQHLEQERRLQALIQQRQMLQQPAVHTGVRDVFSSEYGTARPQDLLLRSWLQEQQATSSIGDFRRHEIFPGQARLSPEAELYVAALRESAAARQLQQQQSALLSGYTLPSLPWGETNNMFEPAGRRPIGTDALPVTSGSGAGSMIGDMSSTTSLLGAPNFGSTTLSDSLGSTKGDLHGDSKQSSSRKRPAKGGGWPKDRPKRPLSAYNIFFKEERARILAGIPEGSAATAGTDGDPTATSRRRRKRNTHGKISFESLAKTIGRRWQEQTPDQVRYYKDKAEVDMQRYRKELEKYNHPTSTETAVAETKPEDEDQKPPAQPGQAAKKPQDDNEPDTNFL